MSLNTLTTCNRDFHFTDILVYVNIFNIKDRCSTGTYISVGLRILRGCYLTKSFYTRTRHIKIRERCYTHLFLCFNYFF